MDMNKLMQQAQEMQEQLAKVQEEAANETVEATAGGGMVTVTANGAGEIKEIKIAKEAIDPDDPEMLADLVLAAVNEALRSAQRLVESKVGPLMGGLGGLGLPGM
ncbi:MAG TPA: YbaB/EbfC family nucleoid-associated protein [Gaiellaceae bacterium]|jgi:DNA-binding YbaB/EbfC family protein